MDKGSHEVRYEVWRESPEVNVCPGTARENGKVLVLEPHRTQTHMNKEISVPLDHLAECRTAEPLVSDIMKSSCIGLWSGNNLLLFEADKYIAIC